MHCLHSFTITIFIYPLPFSGLLNSGKHSDVVLVAAGGKEFSAHKGILAAHSPVRFFSISLLYHSKL